MDRGWVERWRSMVEARAGRPDPGYWDRRARTYARSTRAQADEFLEFLERHLSPRKTLIDVGAGAGRHAVPLAARLEWVTAVEPSDGMRSNIAATENMTVIASRWEDAEVAPADIVICCHVLYGIADAPTFIDKMQRAARERVFVMLRESDLMHPTALIRAKTAGSSSPPPPRFSDLFMLLVEMGIMADVTFLRYPFVARYADMEEALADCRAMLADGFDESAARTMLDEVLRPEGNELVFRGGEVVSGVAHWLPTR
ncbi:MAG: class I SAM-dependent methyltransferase [Candidatus Dormibacterales bacterium]